LIKSSSLTLKLHQTILIKMTFYIL
jgi:hypothetical protein